MSDAGRLIDGEAVTTAGSLAPIVTRLVLDLSAARSELATSHELIRAAIELVAEAARERDRAREQATFLRAQLRASVSGRTVAEERADLDEQVHTSMQVVAHEADDKSVAA